MSWLYAVVSYIYTVTFSSVSRTLVQLSYPSITHFETLRFSSDGSFSVFYTVYTLLGAFGGHVLIR